MNEKMKAPFRTFILFLTILTICGVTIKCSASAARRSVWLRIADQAVTDKTVEIDLSNASAEELSLFIKTLPDLKALQTVDLGKGDGEDPAISWETIETIEKSRPDLVVKYTFTIRKYRFDLQDKCLNLNHIRFDDGGALAVKIAKCMPNLKTLDMDSCGVADEDMSEIRDLFPDVHVVWRVFFGRAYSARTDADRLMISNPAKNLYDDLDDQALKGLYYCNEVKYLDLGHLYKLTDVGYVANMPELEVLIIAMTGIKRIDPLANCHHLNYLEFQTSAACDLTPLKNLKELRDLNICYNFALRSIEPIMDLELDRLYIGCLTPVSPDQINEYRERHPDCIVNTTTYDPTAGGWRSISTGAAPRYAQLRLEMQYDTNPLCYAYNENDRKYAYRFEY